MEKKEGAILSVDKYAAAARQAVADGIVMGRPFLLRQAAGLHYLAGASLITTKAEQDPEDW